MDWLTCKRLALNWLTVPGAQAQNDGGLDATNRRRLLDVSRPSRRLRSLPELPSQFNREARTGGAMAKLSILLQGTQAIPKRAVPGTGLRITRETRALRAGKYLSPHGHSTFKAAKA